MSARTLLFLYTEPPTRRALARDRAEGRRPERLVLATDSIESEDAAFYDEVVELPPAEAVGATLRILSRLAFDDVVVQTEYGLLVGTLLAQARGLRGPTPMASLLTTDKWLCREVLREADVRVPRYALAQSAADVRRFAAGDWPVVLKPVASTLGHLVTKVSSPDELDDVVARIREELPRSPHIRRCAEFAELAGLDLGCDPQKQFLVEEFADGPPLETDGLVFGTTVALFGVTEQIVSPPPTFYVEGYLFPVAQPALETSSRAAIRALGLRDAGFSIEFRGDVLIEVNGRLGEDDGFPELFRAELGRYPISAWIDGDVGARPSPAGGHAIAYVNHYRDGVVREVPAAADGVTILATPGRRLYAPPHPDVAPHLAYALRSHPADAHQAYESARDAVRGLRFEIDGGTRGE